MRRSFKANWYAVISNPVQVVMLAGYAAGLILFGSTGNLCFLLFILVYLIPFMILERTVPNGHPRCIARQLTPFFYCVRSATGRWSIVQKRLPDKTDCRALIRALTAQQRALPAALMDAPGKYRAITHENVLRRIKRMPGAVIESARPVYAADMSATLNYLTRGKCKRCTNKCPAAIGRTTLRQFYDVRFIIEERDVSNVHKVS